MMDTSSRFDLDVPRCTRQCAACERELAEGERVYSALVRVGADYVRQDFCEESWAGPPPDTIAWWQAEIPRRNAKKAKLAPDEVLWELFTDLEKRPEEADKRYVLTLFLIRRKVLKLDESAASESTSLSVYHARNGDEYQVPVVDFDEVRATEIQQELMGLLYAQAEPENSENDED